MGERHGGSFDPNEIEKSQHATVQQNLVGFVPPAPYPTAPYSLQPVQHSAPVPPPPVFQMQPPPPAPMNYYSGSSSSTHAPDYHQPYQQPIYQPGQGMQSQMQPSVAQNEVTEKSIAINHNIVAITEPSAKTTAEEPVKEIPTILLGGRHIAESKTSYRWKKVHHYQPPGYQYLSIQKYRHRDYVGRVHIGQYDDRYLHHHSGEVRKLIVACVDDIFQAPGTSTWRRTYIRKVAPLGVRLATWVINFSHDPQSWEGWWVTLLRVVPAALAMQFLFWQGKPERVEFDGYYAPVRVNYVGEAKVWSNHLENRSGTSLPARNNQIYRVLRPRHLCFLRKSDDDGMHGIDVRRVDEWVATDGRGLNLSYIFIAYSTEHFSHSSKEDLRALHKIAEAAARAAKVRAYWVAASCMKDEKELVADVYRISDVVRGAQGMIIAVGHSKSEGKMGHMTTDALLVQWGKRMWTFPEVLLSPGEHIPVYTRDGDLRDPLVLSKNQFAAHIWTDLDAEDSRQLIDHYIGNAGLSRLELAVTALKCLYRRNTTAYFQGDQAYALMGLLRIRPHIDSTDTPFQAFARLSLANDSDKLLERYLCTLPPDPNQPWFSMADAYNSSLWDIEPYCQVAGVCQDNTVVLDGARGASIRWKSFYRVAYATNKSWRRTIAAKAIEHMTFVLFLSIIFFLTNVFLIGFIFLVLYLYIFFRSPTLLRRLYGGKFTDVQAALFGFEGYLNAATVERAMFGGCFGRMGWSPNGSPMSRTHINEYGEKIGVDPTVADPLIRMRVEAAKQAKPGQMRIFTLVDTYNMQLTLFEAIRPPTCLIFAASEGGMQRAIGCSYDWTTQTMYRETVLRMPTPSLNRADRVPRVKVGIQRQQAPCTPAIDSAV